MGQTRDYYADLELPAGSDIQEVKKQFRKLGKITLLVVPHTSC
jgi:curved DNA-binding protein CbpA